MVMYKILTDLMVLVKTCTTASKNCPLCLENTPVRIFVYSNFQRSGYFLIFFYFFFDEMKTLYR